MKKHLTLILSVLLIISLLGNVYFFLFRNSITTATDNGDNSTAIATTTPKSTDEFNSITVSGTDPIPSANDYDEMIISISADNFDDIFDIKYYTEENDSKVESYNGSYLNYYFVSKLYEQGWIYIDDSTDFRVIFHAYSTYYDGNGNVEYPENEETLSTLLASQTAPFNPIKVQEDVETTYNTYLPTYKESMGSIKFYSINIIEEYEWDTFDCVRTIKYNGKEYIQRFNANQKDYPF